MIEDEVIITGIVGVVSSIVSAWISWFFARKKYNSEVDSNVINNMQDSLNFYKALSDDNRERLEVLQAENIELRRQVAELQTQMFELMTQICLNLSCTNRITSKPQNNVINCKENS